VSETTDPHILESELREARAQLVVVRRPKAIVARTPGEGEGATAVLATERLPAAYIVPPVKRVVDDAIAVAAREIARMQAEQAEDGLSERDVRKLNLLMDTVGKARVVSKGITDEELTKLSESELIEYMKGVIAEAEGK
jgi:hypothetical protein